MSRENEREGGMRKTTVVFAILLLFLPALIPLYFALNEEPGTLRLGLFGLSAGLLVVNAGLLYVIHRWYVTAIKPDLHNSSSGTSDHGSKGSKEEG